MKIPDCCPECGGEIYWLNINGNEGFRCKECEFMDIDDFPNMSSPEYEISLTKTLEEKTGLIGWHKR